MKDKSNILKTIQGRLIERKIHRLESSKKPDRTQKIQKLWENTPKEIQLLEIEKVLDIVKDNEVCFDLVWMKADQEVQKEVISKVFEKYKDSAKKIKAMWSHTNVEIQKENFDMLEQILGDNLNLIWASTNVETQKEKLEDMLNKYSELPEILSEIIQKTKVEAKKEHFDLIYEKTTGKVFSEKLKTRINKLIAQNKNITEKINFDFLEKDEIFENYTEEQILRITNYPEVQKYIVSNYNNKAITNSIKYLLNNDENWIISLDKLVKNENSYAELANNLLEINEMKITEDFSQQLLSIMSEKENYFEIKNYEDVRNFYNIRNETCEKIFNGDLENIPKTLKNKFKDKEDDLYKFAILEHQFGISLDEATRLINRYGTDAKNLPEGNLKDYLILLENIVRCEDIKYKIKSGLENDVLEEPWLGSVDARNAEGQILNMFAELYNETLYNPKEEDKNQHSEIYIDKDGNEYDIDVYKINSDFNMNIRVEGAYWSDINTVEDFMDYYNNTNLYSTGNCESYIGNDNISLVRNKKGNVRLYVGYGQIMKNSLTAAGPFDLGSQNTNFSKYNEKSNFLTPQEMINRTRKVNEMVKDRIVYDENGEVTKYKPDFAVWIEEDTKEERQLEGWKEKRDNDAQWIMTKKLASQLGIPIVVIDRELFAERETDKIEVMKKIFLGEDIKENRYQEYFKQYKNLEKSELIKQMIIKFENNRTGIQQNGKLRQKYFTQDQLEILIDDINKSIDKMPKLEAKKCIETLINVTDKEKMQHGEWLEAYYNNVNLRCKNKYEDYTQNATVKQLDDISQNLFQLYLDQGTQPEHYNSETKAIKKDIQSSKEENSKINNEQDFYK